MKPSWNEIKDKIWMYDDGDGQTGSGFATEIFEGYVIMEDGMQIPVDEFHQMTQSAIDDGSDVSMDIGNHNNKPHEQMGKGANEGRQMMDNMVGQTDVNGIPQMKFEGDQKPLRAALVDQPITKEIIDQNAPVSPLLALIDKSKLTPKKISVTMEIPLLDKRMYNILKDTYGDEEIEMVAEHLINKVGFDELKEAFIDRLRQHYDVKGKSKT